jgi:hypothetical protein
MPMSSGDQQRQGGDLRFPETSGKRKAIDGIVNRYMDRYRVAASVDAGLGTSLLRAAHMLDRPAKLLSPGHVLRVVASRAARTYRPKSYPPTNSTRYAPLPAQIRQVRAGA